MMTEHSWNRPGGQKRFFPPLFAKKKYITIPVCNITNHKTLQAEIVQTTFVVSRFSDIRLGYDFVPSRIQKKLLETTPV